MDFGIPPDGPKFAGILGYDFFSRAVIEIQIQDRGGSFGFNKRRAFIYDPRKAMDAGDTRAYPSGAEAASGIVSKPTYSPLRFVSRTAFLEASVKGECESPASRNLMLLDLAGGATDLIFNAQRARVAGVAPS